MAIAVIPAPIRNTPTPIAATPIPNITIAADKRNKVGTSGFNNNPATPITVKAPANTINDFAMDSQDMSPKLFRTGARAANAIVAMSKAAEPLTDPFINARPAARINRDPPSAASPLAIPSHDIPLIFIRASVNITIAVETAMRPTPILIIFFGINFIAIVTAANAPANPNRPLAIADQDSLDMSLTEEVSIFMATATAIMPMPTDIIFFEFLVSIVKAANSPNSIPTAERPFIIFSMLIEAKSLHDDAKILIALATKTIPRADDLALPANFIKYMKPATSANNTPTPINPFASSSQLSLAKSSHTDAKILIAAANMTILVAPLNAFLPPNSRSLMAPTNVPVNTTIPTKPLKRLSESIEATTFKAEANIKTATATPFIMPITDMVPLSFRESNFPNIATDATRSANNTVMAFNESDNFSLSIREITNIEAANIAIALAILRRAPALS